MSARKEPFSSLDKNRVKMFVCGPTVQDYIHLGHAKTYIFYDVLARYLRLNGYSVHFIINITDVDEKVFDRAKQEGVDWTVVADKYTKSFIEDMKSLNVKTPSDFVRVSLYVDEAIELVSLLIRKGYGYDVNGNVYFDTFKAQGYGKLSHQSRAELMLKVIDPGPGKRNSCDFLLWRKWEGADPAWVAPFSRGRPGWHIEDTAIALKLFRGKYDIHGGASELIYPHHESELAQDESLTGQVPFVKYWIHGGMLMVGQSKMSKSLKNYVTVRSVLKEYDADTIRLFVLSNHYRSDVNFTKGHLDSAQRRFENICRAMHKLETFRDKGKDKFDASDRRSIDFLNKKTRKFYAALDDDINSPVAIEAMLEICGFILERFTPETSVQVTKRFDEELSRILSVLGLCGYTEVSEPVEAKAARLVKT